MSALRFLEAIAPLGIMGVGFGAAISLRELIRKQFGDYDDRAEAILRQRHEFSDEWERALAVYQIPPLPTNHAPYIEGTALTGKNSDIIRKPSYGLESYFEAKKQQ